MNCCIILKSCENNDENTIGLSDVVENPIIEPVALVREIPQPHDECHACKDNSTAETD